MKTELIRPVIKIVSWVAEESPVRIRRPSPARLPIVIQLRPAPSRGGPRDGRLPQRPHGVSHFYW